MKKKWLLGLMATFQLFGCSVRDDITASSTIDSEVTIQTTVLPTPVLTPLSTFDPYDVHFPHDPIEAGSINYILEHLDGNKYFRTMETESNIYIAVQYFDFDSGIVELRTYEFDNPINFSDLYSLIEAHDYCLVERVDLNSLVVNTYKDEILNYENSTCILNYDQNTYSPKSDTCSSSFTFHTGYISEIIGNFVVCYALGDTHDDAAILSNALNSDKELLKSYINELLNYFKE